MLEEQNFHDIVNSDDQMYKDFDNVSMASEDVAGQLIGIIQNHVSEVWSQPRVTKLASEYDCHRGLRMTLRSTMGMANLGISTSHRSVPNV